MTVALFCVCFGKPWTICYLLQVSSPFRFTYVCHQSPPFSCLLRTQVASGTPFEYASQRLICAVDYGIEYVLTTDGNTVNKGDNILLSLN